MGMRRRLSTVADVAVTVAVSVALVAGVSTSAEPSEIAQAWSIVQIAKAHADAAAPATTPGSPGWTSARICCTTPGVTPANSSRSTCHTDERYLG
jgi:hypothetical protein